MVQLLLAVSCTGSATTKEKNMICEPEDMSEATTIPDAPNLSTLRERIREQGDSMALEKYMFYYRDYQSSDNDSILFYSQLMANKHSYSRAYYVMFYYWVNKYNEKKEVIGESDPALIDSAMSNLFIGAKRGVKGCNIIVASLYANGIYVERDTIASNEYLRAAGYTDVSIIRKMYENCYKKKNLDFFMYDNWTTRPSKE